MMEGLEDGYAPTSTGRIPRASGERRGEEAAVGKVVSTKRARTVALLLAAAVTLAGCGAGGADSRPAGQLFTSKQADRFVMQKGDLPPGYKKVGSQSGRVDCDSGYLANR